MQANTTSKISFSALLLIAPFFFWGTAMVAMKGVMDHTTPLFMAGIRLVPAGLLVLTVGYLTGRKMPHNWQGWLWISLFALADGTLFQGFLAEGLMRTNAGLGSVMIDSQPLAVAMLSWWLFQEKIGLIGGVGLAIGVFGISLIGLPDEWIWRILDGTIMNTGLPWQQLFEHGQWLMLLAALSMAVGTVMMPMVSTYVDPVIATGWHMILGGLPLFLGSSLWESQQWVNLNYYDFISLAYSTIFGSAIAYSLFFYFASNGNLTSLSALTFLTPVFALLFGNLFLSESLSNLQWSGVLLTLVSIYLINQREMINEKLFPSLPTNIISEVNTGLIKEDNNNISVADSVKVSSSEK
jgi:drug/metabolite transporter (DMT)-like permease